MTGPGLRLSDLLSPEFRARFQITQLLGSGSFGAVYRARDRSLKRPVVIKLLRPERGRDDHRVERFRREAEIMARLSHPRLIPLLDHGRDGECHYLIAPDLGGVSLEEELRDALPLEPPAVLVILTEILEGLEALHEAGLVHRDLKPANVLRLEDGHLALIDLGLAGVEGAGGTLTSTGQVVGTPAYVSPEQIRGQAPTTSADLYAVGVLAYELLTGTNPFRAPDVATAMQNHLGVEPEPPARVRPEVPAALSGWVLDLLEKDPADRPASARAALDELVRIMGRPTPDPTLSVAQPREGRRSAGLDMPASSPPPSARLRWGAACVLLGLVAIAAWRLSPLPASPTPSPASPRPTGPRLPERLAELATRELEQALDHLVEGEPLLDSDPAAWGENLTHLTTLSRFHAWLADGGRPEELPEETKRSLRAADANYRALGFPAPFGPFLAVPGQGVERWREIDWPRMHGWGIHDEFLPGPLPGWAGEAYRVAVQLERRRQELERQLAAAIETRDASKVPEDFFLHMDFVELTRRSHVVDARVLINLTSFYCTSAFRRGLYVEWFGDTLETFRRFGYCVARSIREQPEEADRMAALYTHLADRFRVFVRGPTTHAPVTLGLGFVPDGPAGAHVAGALLHQILETRVLIPGQDVPGPALEYWQRALVLTGAGPLARRRLALAAREGLYTLGTVGELTQIVADLPGMRTYAERVLDLVDEYPESARDRVGLAITDSYDRLVRRTMGDRRDQALEDFLALKPRLLAAFPGAREDVERILQVTALSHPLR